MSIAEGLLRVQDDLTRAISKTPPPLPVDTAYNPVVHAADPWEKYVRRYLNTKKRVVMVGMNPGPWGMTQTGVPFGDVQAVRSWLGIVGTVNQPTSVHPKRPVDGFRCARREVSGSRLWGLMAERFGTAQSFFKEHAVINYCPLVFMRDSGANITPDKLPQPYRAQLLEQCDRALLATLEILAPRFAVGIGVFATKRLNEARKMNADPDGFPRIIQILHPSPASPAANGGWAERAIEQMTRGGVW